MLTEPQVLAACAALTFTMVITASVMRSRAWQPRGVGLALSNRDAMPEPSPAAARADRAAKNMLENMVLFVAVVGAARWSGESSDTTVLGANLFLWARLAYFPVYVAGITHVRTLLWSIGVAGMAMLGLAAL